MRDGVSLLWIWSNQEWRLTKGVYGFYLKVWMSGFISWSAFTKSGTVRNRPIRQSAGEAEFLVMSNYSLLHQRCHQHVRGNYPWREFISVWAFCCVCKLALTFNENLERSGFCYIECFVSKALLQIRFSPKYGAFRLVSMINCEVTKDAVSLSAGLEFALHLEHRSSKINPSHGAFLNENEAWYMGISP